jgi:hypothetical protein
LAELNNASIKFTHCPGVAGLSKGTGRKNGGTANQTGCGADSGGFEKAATCCFHYHPPGPIDSAVCIGFRELIEVIFSLTSS